MASSLAVVRMARRRPGSGAVAGTARAVLLVVLATAWPWTAAAEPDWSEIGPLFRERCVMCHSQDAAALGLRLDTYEGAIAGSERGPVLLPRNVSGSELVRRLRGERQPRMPFLSRSLSAEEIDLIEQWIAAGLPEARPAEAKPAAFGPAAGQH